jgi:hypothetical protein
VKLRLMTLLGVLVAMTLPLAGVARLSSAAPPTPAGVGQNFKLYLPFVGKDAYFFGGPQIPFGYGWGVYNFRAYWPDLPQYPPTSFNWIKVTDNPPKTDLCGSHRLPYNVLIRLNKTDANATVQQVADDTWTWAHNMETAPGVGKCVDAFEIGNEPNLSGQGAYSGPVNPERYADQLCAAYTAVKNTDPGFIVVSAGLAPTGGSSDTTVAMETETFMRLMLNRIRDTHAGDAGACFDVFGYHNYGFRTGYPTDPNSTDCPADMCFRGAERIFDILLNEYGVVKRLWATEMGWMRDFVAGGCGSASWAPVFAGFQVSNAEQANQLVGAFQYSRANWSWMGAMFVFNLDFNTRPQGACVDEQGWFAVKGYPAESALENMNKTP